tara:strand:- start:312 stop:857 length:546 start_codon:yes stop_codon:yes gene_type:complete
MNMLQDIRANRATYDEKPIFRRLLELYAYDFSVYDNLTLNDHGEYGYKYLDHYWTESDRHPFLLRIHGKPAGFAMVNSHCFIQDAQFAIAEFFVVRLHRRCGIGTLFAKSVINQFPGTWEVRVMASNEPAEAFWSRLITTHYGVSAHAHSHPAWQGPIWTFTTLHETPPKDSIDDGTETVR